MADLVECGADLRRPEIAWMSQTGGRRKWTLAVPARRSIGARAGDSGCPCATARHGPVSRLAVRPRAGGGAAACIALRVARCRVAVRSGGGCGYIAGAPATDRARGGVPVESGYRSGVAAGVMRRRTGCRVSIGTRRGYICVAVAPSGSTGCGISIGASRCCCAGDLSECGGCA